MRKLDENDYQNSFGSPTLKDIEECYRRQLPVKIWSIDDSDISRMSRYTEGVIDKIVYSNHGKTIKICLGSAEINLDLIRTYTFPKPLEKQAIAKPFDPELKNACLLKIQSLTQWPFWEEANPDYSSESKIFLETQAEWEGPNSTSDDSRKLIHLRKILMLLNEKNMIIARTIQNSSNWICMIKDPTKLLALDDDLVQEEIRKNEYSWVLLNEILQKENPSSIPVFYSSDSRSLMCLQALGCISVMDSLNGGSFEIANYNHEKIQILKKHQITIKQLLSWNGAANFHPEIQELINDSAPGLSEQNIADCCLNYLQNKENRATFSLAYAKREALNNKIREQQQNSFFSNNLPNHFFNFRDKQIEYNINFSENRSDWAVKLCDFLQSNVSLIEKRYAIRNYLAASENNDHIFYKILNHKLKPTLSISEHNAPIPEFISRSSLTVIQEAIRKIQQHQQKLEKSNNSIAKEKAKALYRLLEGIDTFWLDLSLKSLHDSLLLNRDQALFAEHQNPRWDTFWQKETTHTQNLLNELQSIVDKAQTISPGSY